MLTEQLEKDIARFVLVEISPCVDEDGSSVQATIFGTCFDEGKLVKHMFQGTSREQATTKALSFVRDHHRNGAPFFQTFQLDPDASAPQTQQVESILVSS